MGDTWARAMTFWGSILFFVEATCQAMMPVIGNMSVYPETTIHDERRAEPFVMPADGTIETISIYHEGGGSEMLLGVYLGAAAPDVRVGITPWTPVSANEGWQTVALTQPLWIPEGTRIWLAWVFEENPGMRYQIAPARSVESENDCDAGMPGTFGSSREVDRSHSVYATYIRDGHPIINEVLSRNDVFSEWPFIDQDGTKQGWIELYNPTRLPISLGEYYLSDSAETPQKWAFPDIVMWPRTYFQVWTSGKNRSEPGAQLHASFNLMDSESVFLTYATPDNQIDMLEEVRVPVDHSYGRYPDGVGRWHFYTKPTPRSANTWENKKRFVIDQKHVSLTVGTRYQLTVTPPDERVLWSSDNPLVWVDPTGGLLAVQHALRENAQATITARSVDGDFVDSCRVTIVSWLANLSELKVVATPYASYILAKEGDDIFYTVDRDLYRTSDRFTTSHFLSTLPEDLDVPKMQVTPFGYFVQCAKTIFESYDLIHWTPSFKMSMGGLYHSLAYHWEPASQTGYLYAGEYSHELNHRHSVCRGVFSATGQPVWETVLDFATMSEWQDDKSVLDSVRHVHTVCVDPYTGHVWVGTGDDDAHSRLLYSDDNGESFRVVGMGSQTWRTLSIWFTQRYVYWSLDTWDNQGVWRISRSYIDEAGVWPCLTPELGWGTTKVGVRYYVTASETDVRFPVSVGDIYRETKARTLDPEHRVRAIDDPEYDYKEKVAELHNGVLWYCLWVHDDRGDPILILGQSPEGEYRDYRGRVFGLKELPNGSVDVQELLSVSSANPERDDARPRLEPMVQDTDGYVYFTGVNTNHRIYKTELRWVDDPLLR